MMSVSYKGRMFRIILAAVMIAAVFVLAGCGRSGAEGQVEKDLEAMRGNGLGDEANSYLEEILSDEGREDLAKVNAMIGDFGYRITESDNSGSEDGGSTIVNVRVTTYNFGKEYLHTMTEFLEEGGDGGFDEGEFYNELMDKLSGIEEKKYIADVAVVCSGPDEDGSWTTDAASNTALRDAMLGGMLSEISALAAD